MTILRIENMAIEVDHGRGLIEVATEGGVITAALGTVSVQRGHDSRYFVRVARADAIFFIEWKKSLKKEDAERLAEAIGIGADGIIFQSHATDQCQKKYA